MSDPINPKYIGRWQEVDGWCNHWLIEPNGEVLFILSGQVMRSNFSREAMMDRIDRGRVYRCDSDGKCIRKVKVTT